MNGQVANSPMAAMAGSNLSASQASWANFMQALQTGNAGVSPLPPTAAAGLRAAMHDGAAAEQAQQGHTQVSPVPMKISQSPSS
mmetsp:Transcript_33133/g.84119  ORF Transcript_33133/g.84119 Transcript_33133/m.84119 type:complete len:84 (-) Transcript_33133:218-469(-)